MDTTQHFIRAHRAKLAWRLVKHGLGVALMTEDREGPEAHKQARRSVHPDDYLEIPLRH